MQPNQSFFKKNKKEILITTLALVVFILVIYFIFFNNKNSTNNIDGKNIENNSGFTFSSLFGALNNTKDKNNQGDSNNSSTTNTDQYYYYNEGLIKIWDKPVAGYGFDYKKIPYTYIDEESVTQKDEKVKTNLIFVDSSTGYLYEKNLLEATSTPIQISDTSYPNVRKAYFLNDKNGNVNKVILQYSQNNVVKSVVANIPRNIGIATSLTNINILPDNIIHITNSSNNEYLAYIVSKTKTTNSKPDIYSDWYLMTVTNNTYTNRIYTSQLTSWKLNVTNSGQVYAYNTDTAYEISTLYKLTIPSQGGIGTLGQVYSGHTGTGYLLDDNFGLISMSTGSGLKIYTNNTFSGNAFSDNNLKDLSFKTLINKCSTNTYYGQLIICSVPKEIKNYDSGIPDAWYQGFTSWNDNLYIINSDYAEGALLFDIKQDGGVFENIDAKNLEINTIASHVLFINKNDGSLWSLNIENILFQEGD